MTLTDMAEYAVPKPSILYRLHDAFCGLCGFDQIAVEHDQVACTSCHSRICVLCGAYDVRVDFLKEDGWHSTWTQEQSWLMPGICSTHEGDPRIAALAIPATPGAALTLTN